MQKQLSLIRSEFQSDLSQVQHSRDLERLKIKYLGKKGTIQELMQHLRDAPADEL